MLTNDLIIMKHDGIYFQQIDAFGVGPFINNVCQSHAKYKAFKSVIAEFWFH